MSTQVASLHGVLTLDDKQWKSVLGSAKSGLGGLGSSLKAAGSKISNFGKQWTIATAPIAAGLGLAVKKSHDFDRAMSNVNAILGITGTEAANLRSEILSFGGSTTFGPLQTADAFYQIVSGVQDASTHMAILEASVATAEAGQADLTATTSGLISAMNAYGFAAEDAAFVSDVFTRTVGMGVLTMDEMASAFPQVTGIAAGLGLEIEDMAGSLAYLTTQGFSASQSATFMKAMMTTLLKPTKDMEKAIALLGFESGEAMIKSLGLVGSYEALRYYGGGSLAGLVTNTEALQGGMALTKDTASDFLKVFKEGEFDRATTPLVRLTGSIDNVVARLDGATEAARKIQGETVSWETFSSKLHELSIVVGDQLAPVLDNLLTDTIMPLVEGVIEWMDQNPELSGQIIGLIAGAVVLGPVITAVGAAVSALGTAIGIILGPIGLLALGIAGIVAAAEFGYPGGFQQLFLDAGESLQMLAGIITGVLVRAAQGAEATIRGLIAVIQELHRQLAHKNTQELLRATITDVEAGNTPDTAVGRITGRVREAAGTVTPSRDSGGPGMPGQAYMIGTGAQPEMFVPNTAGQFYPNAGSGVQIGSVTVYANDEAGGRAAGRAFADELQLRWRERG